MKYLVYIALILIIWFFVHKFLKRFKFPKITAISVFTGAVKVGKSAVSLACALSVYRKVRRQWRIRCFFRKLFNKVRKVKKPLDEEPLFYSNIKLATIPYCELTHDHILRKKRFNFRSVVFVDEASLLADSQLVKIPELNVKLLIFFKLFGHETHGGYAIFNSQQISDLHISLRRCMAQYFYIHSTSKYIPFVTLCKMREERYAEDGTVLNSYNDDVEDSMKTVIFRSSVFKKYDFCCYSSLTDDLAVENRIYYLPKNACLKNDKLISFRPEFANLYEKVKDEDNIERIYLTVDDLKGEL